MDKKNRKQQKNGRFARLAVMGETIFHTGDVANIWGIANRNTLYQTLSRYVKQGLIHRLQKGLYSLRDFHDLDPYEVGVKALHGPAYVTCETVLYDHGLINQRPAEITLVASDSRRYSLLGQPYRARQLQDRYLHNNAGLKEQNGVRLAGLERAVADMLYFYPNKHFDAVHSGLIDWRKVRDIARSVGYDIEINIPR